MKTTGGIMATTFPDGRTASTEAKAGEARWLEAVTHANENTGSTDIRALIIELKEPAKQQKEIAPPRPANVKKRERGLCCPHVGARTKKSALSSKT